jgi:hypothetical protein
MDNGFVIKSSTFLFTFYGRSFYNQIKMKSDSQANHAYHEIRRHILTAQLQPGVRLKEDYWANSSTWAAWPCGKR